MDPLAANVLAGTIANVITGISSQVLGAASALAVSRPALRKTLREDSDIGPLLNRAMAAAAKSGPYDAKLQAFLVSPEVETCLRQIFVTQLAHDDVTIPSLRAGFIETVALHLDSPPGVAAAIGGDLFEALLKACLRTLSTGIGRGLLSAHEAQSAARTRVLLDGIRGIDKKLTILATARQYGIHAYLDFEVKYRAQVQNRHATITPPHFDVARRIPIDTLYVTPHLEPLTGRLARRIVERATHPLPKVLRSLYRAVVLGTPGSGKSTLAHKLCHDLTAHYSDRLLAGREVTPCLVILRDYGAAKKERGLSILQFIESVASSKYQLTPPPGAVEYLLLSGRLAIVFDGLDELLETSYRVEIAGNIESFCSMYPNVLTLVTSREVGYQEAPLDKERFDLYRIAPFDEAQVSDYASKWFLADEDVPGDVSRQKAVAFLAESRGVPDLRSNPLMLALMCNLYKGEHYIPSNRPDVYEKCALMLFERWDKSRGLFVPLPFEAHIRPAMMHLAYWIYSDEGLQGGVSEGSLVRKAAEYLMKWRFENADEATHAASEFVDFCKGRAWVFTDTGTTKGGEALFQFTHRTFLEYFTAEHLVRTHGSPVELGGVLVPRVRRQEWDVVAQLAVQSLAKKLEGAADAILEMVLEEAAASGSTADGLNLLAFAARCLEFLVPRPQAVRQVVSACVERCIEMGLDFAEGGVKPAEDFFPGIGASPFTRLIVELLQVTPENLKVAADSLEKAIVDKVKGVSTKDAIRLHALEIGLHVPVAIDPAITAGTEPLGWPTWRAAAVNVARLCEDDIELLKREAGWLAAQMLWWGKLTVEELVSLHGTSSLFQSWHYEVLPWTRWSVADSALSDIVFKGEASARGNRLNLLAPVGSALLAAPTPWVKPDGRGAAFQFWWHGAGRKASNTEELSAGDAVGAALLLAVAVERAEGNRAEVMKWIAEAKGIPIISALRATLQARYEPVLLSDADRELATVGLAQAATDLLRRWVRGTISFVDARGTTST